MAPLPSTALKVIVLVYVPAVSAVEVTVTVKVAVPPLAMAAGLVVVNQLLPAASTEGVVVIMPAQLPTTLTVKLAVFGVGLLPTFALKVSDVADGVCKVQGGSTVSVIATWIMPMDWFVTLSTALRLSVPV